MSKSVLQGYVQEIVLSRLRSESIQVGERIKLDQIAKELGLSRSPVRAVFDKFVEEGLLEKGRGGYRVKQLPPRQNIAPDSSASPEARAYQGLVDRITIGELTGVTSEEQLARTLQASRGEVAAALVRLNHEGLAIPIPGGRWRFVEFNRELMSHSYQMRMYLEPGIVGDLTVCPDPERVENMRRDHVLAVESLSGESLFEGLFELDARFHEMIIQFSENPLMIDLMRKLSNLRRLSEYLGRYRLDRVAASLGEHIQIMEAMQQGDFRWASDILRYHLQKSLRQMNTHYDKDIQDLSSGQRALPGNSQQRKVNQ